ncbi:33402_t:CDS:2, partial [Gigaspora margarita]
MRRKPDSIHEYYDTYKDNLTTNHEISVTFHVHMPENLDKSIHPLVVGNIKELGNWTRPVVELYQIEPNSTYWVSDPVKIYIRAINVASTFLFGDQIIIMEGHLPKDNRELQLYGENQYDIWNTNHFKKLYSPDLNKNFRFVSAISIDSILNYFSSATDLLQALEEVKTDNLLPSNAKRPFTVVTSSLIIRKENMDCEISNFLRDDVSKCVDSDNPYDLDQHFKSFTKELCDPLYDLQQHPQMKYVHAQIIQLVDTIKNKIIKMGLLETLTKLTNNELIKYFNTSIGFNDNEITGGMLDFLRKKSHEHSEIAAYLFSFYYKWCYKTEDFHDYLNDLTGKMVSLRDISLDEFIYKDY